VTYKIRVVAIADNGQEQVHDLPCLQRTDLTPETIGLSLAESKAILRDIQQICRGAPNRLVDGGLQTVSGLRPTAA
jgi:hypothetical protein